MKPSRNWAIVLAGTFIAFVILPLWESNQPQEYNLARAVIFISAICSGWAMFGLFQDKNLSRAALLSIATCSFLLFIFGQLVTMMPPYQSTTGAVSIAAGVLFFRICFFLFSNKLRIAKSKEEL